MLEVDPATGRQWRVEAHGVHFGGSLDAFALGLIEAPKTWQVVEFKTHSAKSFRELVAKGVAEPRLEVGDERHRDPGANLASGHGIEAVDLALDLEDRIDMLHRFEGDRQDSAGGLARIAPHRHCRRDLLRANA